MNTITQDSLVAAICARVTQAPVRREPFPHLIVDDILPADVFTRLVADLPAVEELTPLSEVGWRSVSHYDSHATAAITELNERSDLEAWSAVESALLHQDFETAMRDAFAEWTSDVPRDRAIWKQVRLDRGEAGAHLTPHTDAPSAFVKVLIYVAAAGSHPSLDTVMYEPVDLDAWIAHFGEAGDYTDGNYCHEPADQFREVSRVQFRPNRLFVFARTRDSLHGLEPLAPEAAPRYLISAHFRRT
jgi:hypothetical protein